MVFLSGLWDKFRCWQLAAGKGRVNGGWARSERKAASGESQVIKHSDTLCRVVMCLRWRGGDESLWNQPKFGFLVWGKEGFSASSPRPSPPTVVGREGDGSRGLRRWWVLVITVPWRKRLGHRGNDALPYFRICGCIGRWIGARKLEGERDVGGRRILCLTGESPVLTAEPAGSGTAAEVQLPYSEEAGSDTFAGVGWFHCSLT
jgi:hypothetical protein